MLPEPLWVVPGLDILTGYYNDMLYAFIPWFADTFLDPVYKVTAFPRGSGDTTYNWILWWFVFGVSVIGSIIWSVVDMKRPNYKNVKEFLDTYVRYTLFISMTGYGFAKVFKTQFPFPGLGRLTEMYGESSPMGLAWAFMGYSELYNFFTGGAEVLCGLLLLFRKTRMLGAMLTIGVMTNVFFMNMSFDIPVKLYSFLLLCMGFYLLAPDLKRLCNMFILQKPTGLSSYQFPYKAKWLLITRRIFKWIVLPFYLIMSMVEAYEGMKEWGASAPKAPMYGIYVVDQFIRNNDTIPAMATDTTRWSKFKITYRNYASMEYMNRTKLTMLCEVDTVNHVFNMTNYTDTTKKYFLNYFETDSTLNLEGTMLDDAVIITMNKLDVGNFLLVNRGFNWINEYPFNR